MASILRSSKFVRYFSGLARNFVFNSTKETEGNFVQHSQILCSTLTHGFTTAVPKPDQNLERSLKRLDHDVRRTGRISRRDIEEVLEEIRLHRSATSSQSLLVIRCCGNLVPEELPEVRTALVQEIWKTLNNLNVSMDVSHYNALLRVYLENEHTFSPTEFLADLEAKGVEPNRVTYQRLISRYCQNGDIEGATRILEFMREKQLPINEHVFNALIMGHSQAEDMESSLGILSVMKQAGLEPTADTYTTLLCSYAKVGDVTAILATLDTCEKQDIFLLDKDLFDVIYTLATNGHSDQVDNVIRRLRKSSGYNQDAVNLILRLTNKGQEEIAFKMLKTMPRGTRSDGALSDTGTFFIKQMVKAKCPTDKILSICKELQSDGLNARAFMVAVEAGVTSGSITLAIPFMAELKKSGMPIRQHYFWPLICTEAKSGNSEHVLAIIRRMHNEFELPANSETIREYVVPNLTEKNGDKLVTLLRSAGVSMSTACTSVVYNLLIENRLKDATTLATSYSVYYQPGLYRRPLVNALIKTNDIDSYIRFVRQMYDNLPRLETVLLNNQDDETVVASADGVAIESENTAPSTSQSDMLGQLVLDVLVHYRHNRAGIVTQILTGFVEQGLTISNAQADKIQDRLGSELTTEISKLLGQLTAGDLEPIALEKSTSRQSGFTLLSIDQLERMIKQQDAKGENSKGLKRFLLSACFRSKDLDKTEQIIERLEAEGFVFTAGIYAQLIDLYCHHDRSEKAMQTYDKIRSKEVDFLLDNYKTVRLAAVLVASNRMDEAIQILEANKKMEKVEELRVFNYNATCWRLLNSLADSGRADDLQRVYDTLENNNYIESNNALLGPLVKVHIVNNDLHKAVDTFEAISSKHNCTPWKNDLACKLIQAEDATNLQRLTDLSTNIHGEVNSLYDLVFSFVECGRIRQARKILETPGLRSRPQKINVACERYQQEGKVEPLEGLVEATRDLNHIDRGDIYYNLLLSYTKDDQPEKALGLWTKMQEENIGPTEAFLVKLGTFLQSKGLPVPFSVPANPIEPMDKKQNAEPAEQPKRTTKSSNATVIEGGTDAVSVFKKNVRANGDIDRAIAAKGNIPSADKLSVLDQSLFIEALLKADRQAEANKAVIEMLEQNCFPMPRIFRYYLNRLSNTGDIETLQKIEAHLSSDTKKLISFDNRLCHAYVINGKAEQYLDKLELEIDNVRTDEDRQNVAEKFPRGGAIGILEQQPQLCEKFEKLANKYAAHKILAPINVLWMHHFVLDNTDEHQRLWKSHVAATPRLMFQRIIHVAREQQNETLVRNLIKQLKTTSVTDGALGIAYSCLLDVQATKEQYDEGLVTIDEALKDVCLEHFNRTALLRIKEGVERANKTFPHMIPDKSSTGVGKPNSGPGGAADTSSTGSSSSSSSSSSSDDEPEPSRTPVSPTTKVQV